MTATVRQKFDLRKYSRLVSKVAPLVIETKEEFERALESLVYFRVR
jgi:hypothetical protein